MQEHRHRISEMESLKIIREYTEADTTINEIIHSELNIEALEDKVKDLRRIGKNNCPE